MTHNAKSNIANFSGDAPGNNPALANALINYCLHLADNALIMGHRLSEWTGHGPMLEQDIALTNIALDLIGQARNFYQYAASCINDLGNPLAEFDFGQGNNLCTEDTLAYWRTANQYRNVLLTELPNRDWAFTLLKLYFFSSYQWLFYQELASSKNIQLSAIAAKSFKEVTYHVKWSSEWVIRLGDGTKESHQRLSNALNELEAYTPELFVSADFELAFDEENTGADLRVIKNEWACLVNAVFSQAGLALLSKKIDDSTVKGKQGIHSNHLQNLLQQMQYLPRAHPGCEW